MRAPPVALAFLLLAGCLAAEETADDDFEEEWIVSGVFTESATQAQIEEAGRLVEDAGGQIFILESFPPQFQARVPTPEACGAVLAALQEKPYVAEVGMCHTDVEGSMPDEPVATEA